MIGADVGGEALTIRLADFADVPALEALIAASARALGRGFYSEAETEAAIAHVFGVDSELIADGSYFVAERGGAILGCGGWSRRKTVFGSDRAATRDAGEIDPATEPARIRAFFVAPDAARRGVGAALLAACEAAAWAHGFRRTTLMATLPGEPFYERHGYRPDDPIYLNIAETTLRFVPMMKLLLHIGNNRSSPCDKPENSLIESRSAP
jgi:GNAT superfamily N-acetyltransferase